jgi:hypothetical protein
MPAEEIHPVRRCQANVVGACPLPHNQGNTGICTQEIMEWLGLDG